MATCYFTLGHGPDMRVYQHDGTRASCDALWSSSAEYAPLSTAKGKELHREQCRRELRELLPEGSTVYTCLRRVSSSGMSRQISVHIIEDACTARPRLRDITGFVAGALDNPMARDRDALQVSGCGMDMGFHVVNSLEYALGPGRDAEGNLGRLRLFQEWI